MYGNAACSLIVAAAFLLASILAIGISSLNAEKIRHANTHVEGDDIVNIGWVQDFLNWNPLVPFLASDYVAYRLVFSTLFQYNEDWSQTANDLAVDYYQVVWPAGNMSTYINITDNAYFRNAADPEDTSHSLTAFDVEYTLELIQANPGGAWDYYLSNVTGVNITDDGEPWDHDRTDNPFQVRIDTEYTEATLIDDLVWIPILPKYVWYEIPEPDILSNMAPEDLVGSGPFYFDSEYIEFPNTVYEFSTAPNYHAASDYVEERDIDFDGIRFYVYANPETLAAAMSDGQVDVVDMWSASLSFWNSFGDGASVPIIKQVTHELAMYDIAINAIPEELWEAMDYGGERNKILLDPIVRKAIGMTLDKRTLVEDCFYGMPTLADSVLNPGFWQAEISDPLPFNTEWALENLTAAGYSDTDSDGVLEVTSGSLAYSQGWAEIGDELRFRLDAPQSDPGYATVGMAWVDWAAEAGIALDFELQSEGVMWNMAWYNRDYDIWVWSWYYGPEPLSNLRIWATEEMDKAGCNVVGPIGDWWWIDEANGIAQSEYDNVFREAAGTLDRLERKALVDTLQDMIYDEYVELPPLYPNGLYAMTPANFVGWGDWDVCNARTITSGMHWLWYDLKPAAANTPPIASFEVSPSTGNLDQVFLFDASASADEEDPGEFLNVRWDWEDDGVWDTLWSADKTEQHQYGQEGEYTVRLEVMDTSLLTDSTAELILVDSTPPIADAGPNQTIDEGIIVILDGSGSCDNIDVVNYTWIVFDGSEKLLYGVSPTYIFETPGTYTVVLNVTDVVGYWTTDEVTIAVNDTTTPLAVAGPDQYVEEDVIVELDGSGSSDNYGIANYSWSYTEIIDGNEVETYLMGERPTTTFENPGEYIITLLVVDYAGLWDTDIVVIAVSDTTSPTADAGADQMVDEDLPIVFDGSGSKDNAGIDNYTWSFTDGISRTLFGVSQTYVFATPGTYTITLNVTDVAGNWDTDEIKVTVNDVTIPSADAGPDQTVDEGSLVTFDGSNSSDNVDIVNYTWTFTYKGHTVDLYGEMPAFRFDEAGAYTVVLTVKDAAGLTETDVVEITVEEKAGISMLAIGAIGVIAAIAALVVFMMIRKKKPPYET